MREVLNISISKDLNNALAKLAKKSGYSTKSEFFRHIIREKVAEADMLKRLEISRREIAQGKGKVLRSLADLD